MVWPDTFPWWKQNNLRLIQTNLPTYEAASLDPDWCYISPEGERIINTDMYAVSINAPYVQECAFRIIEEVIDNYDIDGIFLNMPGYQTSNPYEGQYHGIDQNAYDKQRFFAFSNGMTLPVMVSNSSIQQISFQSRYNAVEPEEVAIRLYENMANGSGLDISLMGDLRGYEDERNFEVIKKIYAHHKKYAPYFGKYTSMAEVAVIAPGYWPGGEAMQEYRGIQLMLKEAHLPFDIIEDARIGNLEETLKKYRLIILPQITYLNPESVRVLKAACQQGTHLIATNQTMYDDEAALLQLFGARIIDKDHKGSGNYLSPENKAVFKRFKQQKMIFWKFNLGLYDLTAADTVFLPILTKGRPGPPEIIGGHEPSGYYAMGVKQHGKGKAVILPMNIGRLYYLHGYEEHKNILLDVIDDVFPEVSDLVQTNAPARVEVILQQYLKNVPDNVGKKTTDGMILHLVNLTGFSGNTYFKPLPVYDLVFRIRADFKPAKMFTMVQEQLINFNWKDGYLAFKLDKLEAFEGVVINK